MTKPKTKQVPEGNTLAVNEFIGHDGQHYLDLAVDSGNGTAVVWLRRRLKDNKYFLVASVARGHVLTKELSQLESKELYWELADRLPLDQAFPKSALIEIKPKCRKMTS